MVLEIPYSRLRAYGPFTPSGPYRNKNKLNFNFGIE
jgi:hypothetical protein